jgi:UrcA family protein
MPALVDTNTQKEGSRMSEKFTSLLAACAVTFVVFAASAPATAKQRPITVTATAADIPVRYVSYRDLNLTLAGDEQRLVRRVRFAAKDVCAESVQGDLSYTSGFMKCRANAWQGAATQIDRAVLRAHEIAANGWSAIAPVAITISVK